MKQMTLSASGFDRYSKTTRRAAFLAEMERVVPWTALCALVEPFYPKPGNGRPPIGVSDAAPGLLRSNGAARPEGEHLCDAPDNARDSPGASAMRPAV